MSAIFMSALNSSSWSGRAFCRTLANHSGTSLLILVQHGKVLLAGSLACNGVFIFVNRPDLLQLPCMLF